MILYMIQYPSLRFAGTILLEIRMLLLGYLVFDLGFLLLWEYSEDIPYISIIQNFNLTWEALTVFGLAIALLIQFRNSNAYQRFHEARQIWGDVANDCRNITLVLKGRISKDSPESARQTFTVIQYNLIALVHAVRLRLLQGGVGNSTLRFSEFLLPSVHKSSHKPNAIMESLHRYIYRLFEDEILEGNDYFVLKLRLNDLVNRYGNLERIKKNPIPRQYTILTYRLIHIYVLLTSILLLTTYAVAGVVLSLISVYIFFGFARIGWNIEDPFTESFFTFDMKSLVGNIERNLEELADLEDT